MVSSTVKLKDCRSGGGLLWAWLLLVWGWSSSHLALRARLPPLASSAGDSPSPTPKGRSSFSKSTCRMRVAPCRVHLSVCTVSCGGASRIISVFFSFLAVQPACAESASPLLRSTASPERAHSLWPTGHDAGLALRRRSGGIVSPVTCFRSCNGNCAAPVTRPRLCASAAEPGRRRPPRAESGTRTWAIDYEGHSVLVTRRNSFSPG